MKNQLLCLIFCLLIVIFSCKKPYNPPVVASNGSFLVVEGLINSGADSTVISVSRTVNIATKVTANPELNALVVIEGANGGKYPLTDAGNGRYVSAGLNLDNSQKYRLRINTTSSGDYVSEFVPVYVSPPIDSVNFKIGVNGVNIYSNTHDQATNTRYYRWDYQETWIIHSKYFSYFKSNGDTVLARNLVNENVYTCWQSMSSSTIILNSSAKLAQNVILQNPITFIGSTSEKLGTEYSILVKQYSLSPDAYNFYQSIKTVTEQLGSIFDAEPSQLKGNIHSVNNPAEPVIGFASVGSSTTKRLFIRSIQLPAWKAILPYDNCTINPFLYKYLAPGSKVPENQVDEYFNANKGAINPLVPVDPISPPQSPILGFTGSTPDCVDCTLRGTNKQPVYWVY